MTERWRNGLEELSRVPMSEGLLERAQEGPRMSDPGRPGVRRAITVVVVALGIFAAGAFGAWVALRPRPAPGRPASEPMPQRVYGDTLCIWRSSPGGRISATSGIGSTSDPAAACEEHRAEEGAVVGNDMQSPAMIACVNPEYPAQVSVVEVASSPDGKCSGLGFEPLPDGWDANLPEWRGTEDAAASVFPGRTNGITCQRDEQKAVGAWRKALDDHGFTSWKVVVDVDNAGWPCFNYKVGYDAMEITIVRERP